MVKVELSERDLDNLSNLLRWSESTGVFFNTTQNRVRAALTEIRRTRNNR